MRGEKQIVSVAAVSNAVQCKYAAAILADLARRRREEDPGIAAGARCWLRLTRKWQALLPS